MHLIYYLVCGFWGKWPRSLTVPLKSAITTPTKKQSTHTHTIHIRYGKNNRLSPLGASTNRLNWIMKRLLCIFVRTKTALPINIVVVKKKKKQINKQSATFNMKKKRRKIQTTNKSNKFSSHTNWMQLFGVIRLRYEIAIHIFMCSRMSSLKSNSEKISSWYARVFEALNAYVQLCTDPGQFFVSIWFVHIVWRCKRARCSHIQQMHSVQRLRCDFARRQFTGCHTNSLTCN